MHTPPLPIPTSKLLTADQPLVLLSSLVETFGVVGATLLQQLHYISSQSSQGLLHDGYKWIYNTVEQWRLKLKCWSTSTIERTIARLKQHGVLLIDKLSAHKSNRTNYYRIDYSKIAHLVDFSVQVVESQHPITPTGSTPHTEVSHPITVEEPIPSTRRHGYTKKALRHPQKQKKSKTAISSTVRHIPKPLLTPPTASSAPVAQAPAAQPSAPVAVGTLQPTQAEPSAAVLAQLPEATLRLWRQLRMAKLDIAATDPRLALWINQQLVKTVVQRVLDVTDQRWHTPEQLGLHRLMRR